MKISFWQRFLAFTLSFWGGIVVALFLLKAVNAFCFSPYHFWAWFLDEIHYDVFPVALAELFRSPIMGLLFALLGSRKFNLRALIRFGAVCGGASYIVADAFNLAGFASWNLAPYFRQPLVVEYIILGLPIVLILLSRFEAPGKTEVSV
ncbi:MAG TPA: hypothetical protein VGC39_03795 [Candidatus Methylacidiphilales bacterium]